MHCTDNSVLPLLKTTLVTFEDLVGLNGQQFGFGAGQPYKPIGLTMGDQVVVEAANLASRSGGIAVRSAEIESSGYANSQWFTFDSAQRVVGFYYQDVLATGVTIQALDQSGSVLEAVTLPARPDIQHFTFIFPNPQIFGIALIAPHKTYADAEKSRTFIDDLEFTI